MAMLVPDNTKYRAETVTRFDPASGALDAFGRLRVASPYTIFDSNMSEKRKANTSSPYFLTLYNCWVDKWIY